MIRLIELALLVVSCSLVVIPVISMAASESHGIALLNEAQHLRAKAGQDGEYEAALKKFEQALSVFKQAGSDKGMAATLCEMGLTYYECGLHEKAQEFCERSQAISNRLGDSEGEMTTLIRLGKISRSFGLRQKAIDYYERALIIATSRGDLRSQARVLTDLGWEHWFLAHYQKALDCFRGSLAINKQIGDSSGLVAILRDVGRGYRFLGKHQEALHYYREALAIAQRTKELGEEGETLRKIGYLHADIDNYEEAEKNLRGALALFERAGLQTHGLKDSLAHLYLDIGDIQRAEPLVRETRYHITLGRLFLVKSDHSQSIRRYEMALRGAERSRNVGLMLSILTGLGKVYEIQGDYEKAAKYYREGVSLTEEIRKGLFPAERQNFFEVKVCGFRRSEPAKGLTRVLLKLGQSRAALEASELTKARAFSDQIALTSTRGVAGVPTMILEMEDQIVSRIAALKKELTTTDKEKHPQRFRQITSEVEKSEKELTNLIEILWHQHRNYAAVKYPRPVTLVESALESKEYAIVFAVLSDGIAVWLLKGQDILHSDYLELNVVSLNQNIKSFRRSFEEARRRDFDADLARDLYAKLMAPPLAKVPDGTPIVIIPDGILAVLPFEALVVKGTEDREENLRENYPEDLTYLADLHPLSYYQSLSALTLARTMRDKSKPANRLLVIADPVFQDEDRRAQGAEGIKISEADREWFPDLMRSIEDLGGDSFQFKRLPETALLAENLKKLFGPDCDSVTGMKATKHYFFKSLVPKLNDYRSIVFATHGLFSNKVPGLQEPFLALTMVPPGTDGFLKTSDVMTLKMNADVVALTACQTGLGRELSGEGIMSMGRAFQHTGAKSVLMSLWPVAERPSVILVESFFKNLKGGMTKLEALKLARQEIRRQGYEHPFFWAPFILVGENQ